MADANANVNKRYKVTVDRQYYERRDYVIEAPHEDSPEFHEAMRQCMDDELEPDDTKRGFAAGEVRFAEIDPEFRPMDTYAEADTSEEGEEEEEDDEAFVKWLDEERGISINRCPFSNVPFIGFIEADPILPFDYALSVEERDKLLEDKEWAATDQIVLMSWLDDCWVNLDKHHTPQEVVAHWDELLRAVHEYPDIYAKLNT